MEGVLGISPGTKRLGVALMRNHDLVDWQVKTFEGKWSERKLKKIIIAIDTLIDDHGIREIAVKIPGTLPFSMGFTQLIGAMNVLFERKGIRADYYTLSDMQNHFSQEKKMTKASLAAFLAHKHSELLPVYHKGEQKRVSYYNKVFEAVAAASLLERQPSLDIR